MKNALILHGTRGSSQENWFPWLGKELEERGWKVWVPDLPQPETPNIQRYNHFLFDRQDWQFNEESLIVGHSSGAVAILGLLAHLPAQLRVGTCVLVGAFRGDLGWEALSGMVENFDFEEIKKKADKFIFIHSDDDPHCPLEHAEYLSQELGGELIVLKGQKHFSIKTAGEAYTQFPFLLELIEKLDQKKSSTVA